MARKLVLEVVADTSQVKRGLDKARGSLTQFERQTGHLTRGVAAGSGAFKSLGHQLAFASAGFLAFASATKFLHDSVDAAQEAVVAQRSLAAQMRASGESFAQHREEIEKAALSYGRFGFENDEVVASLTVLERGTGKISQALKLQTLTADLARAKHIDLAAAAQTVAKVFGGQETALRRAVPGLAKNAHGWDLIALAQRKMAGQAAANTTASERFAAVMHDTQEIIGGAILPTLNKYLTSLSVWLEKQNQSGELQKRVNDIMGTTSAVLGRARDIIERITRALGGWKNALTVLAGAWVGLKVTAIGSTVAITTANLVAAGVVERAWQAALISTGWGALAVAAGIAATEIIFHWKKVKVWFQEFWLWLEDAGLRAFLNVVEPFSHIPTDKLGGWARDLKTQVNAQLDGIAQRYTELQDQLAKPTQLPPGLQGPVGTPGGELLPPGLQGPVGVAVKQAKRTAEQLNQWFDAMIGRKLSRGALLPLKQQLAVFDEVIQLLVKRIKKTHDITRLLNLNDQLLQVRADRVQVQQELADQAAAAAQAARDEALAWADFAVERAAATDTLKDDLKAAQAKLALLKKQAGVGRKTAEQARAIWEAQQEVVRIRKEMAKDERGGTRFKPLDVKAFIRSLGLNLSVNDIRKLTVALSQIGPGGTMPGTRSAAFAGAGGVVVNGDVHVHGVQDPKGMEGALHKRARRRPHDRRGN